MNRRRVFNKLGKIFMVMTMILSMCFSAGNTKVNAWDGNVPHEFTRVKNIKYPKWWGRKIASLKQWSTYSCKYNGQWSYCLESSKKTPSAGNYTASVIENNSMVRKLLYYGFGGPAAWDVFGPDHDLKTAVCPDDSYLSNDDVKYLLTHIFLSGAYSGDWNGFSEELFNQTFGGSYGTNLMNIYRGIEQLPDPSNGANFSTGNTAKFTATYDKANSLQKTNTVKFNASSSESVQLPLQNNVTIHIAGTSNTKTGGTATVYGGQSFYLTTPATNPLSNYQSGNLTSSAKGKFCALAISDGNGASQTHGSWYQETADTLKYSVEWMGFGYIDLKKTSANPDMTNNSRLYSLEGAKYGIYEGDSLVQELTTDVNGYAKSSLLLEGKYTVKEISASKGYKVDTESHSVTVTRGQTTTTNVTEKPTNDPVAIQIIKNDIEKGESIPQGGATLEGAEFTIKYYNDFYDRQADLPAKATRTWVVKTIKLSSGRYVADLNLSNCIIKEKSDELYKENGFVTLPLGTITIQETKAPEGYFLENATLSDKNGSTTRVDNGVFMTQINQHGDSASVVAGNTPIVSDKVKKQRIQLFKSGEREGISGVVKGLQGAEFTWKLKTEVDNVGWDNAKTYAVITTNENGRAITDYLPYGKYLVRETKTPKDYMTAPDFTVSVTKDSSEYNELEQVKLVSVNNKPFASYVKLVKVDEDTGKKVTLNSASFKIKDAQGNYVVQKVSGTKVDTFTTNSDNEIIPVVEKGTVTLPLMLNAGTYTIEELKTPKGFLDLEKPVEFVISSTYDYDVDQDADPIVEVKIKNRQPKGEIKLNKTVMDLDTDTDLVDRSDLSKIQFVLKAKEDIYSSIDGSLMFEKDSVITTENSGAIVNTGSEVGNGIYALSLDGYLDISNLPMSTKGASYYLQEVKTLDGCVLDTAQYDAVFKQSDFTTKNYIKSFDVENKTTDFEFNKTDVTGDKEVEGAQLTITDEDGNVVDQWTSDGKVHSIEGLVVGKTYTLSETVTAKDYVKATDIKFTVKNSSELETVTMKDKQVFVSKTTVGGEEVTGAHMQIIDEDGNIIDEWYSEEKSHIANGLEEGKTYTLHEDLSPLGFNLANDFTFEVTKEKENQTVEMIDTVTEVNKTDVDGKAVKEATLSIVSEKTKDIVDQWVTGKHILDIDKDIKSQLEENGKAEGTYMDEEDSMVMFSIAKNKDRDDYTFMQVKDGITTYSNIDLDGNETTHRVQGLVTGEKYILRETKTPEEYVQAKEIEFTAGEDEDQTLVMQDKQVSFTKTDVTGEKEVEGATITVKEKETDKIVDEWISGKEDHKIKGLEERKTYILSEIVTPEDYVKATDIEFTVTEEKVNQEVNMKDKQVKVSKTTAGGDEVVGASMQIRDEFGNIIDEWISDGKEHYATGLVEGKKYILHEDLAPTGFNLANDFEFEVSKEKENQTVEMIDTLNEVSKVDEKGNLLKGAEMTVTSNKTKNIIDKWISGQHIFDVTDEMKSQLKETGKAEGMYVDNEDSTVQYSIVKNKGKDDYTVMFVEDGITTYTNIDLDGNETRHMIQGLEAGEEYVLKETKTPNGYATFKTQTFTAEEGKDTSLSMVDEDTKVEVSKQDITTKKELEGAKLKVTDKDGKVIDEWTSGKQPHMIKNLTAGETYTLTEAIAPKNYKVAESLRFTVKDTGKIQRVIMYDRPVNNYVETGDENNYYFILMLICMIFIGRLLKSYLNNFID